jgi:hypothetical protein
MMTKTAGLLQGWAGLYGYTPTWVLSLVECGIRPACLTD